MASRTIICSSVKLWALIRPGIKAGQRSKIHCRVPHPLERGLLRYSLQYNDGQLDTHGVSYITQDALIEKGYLAEDYVIRDPTRREWLRRQMREEITQARTALATSIDWHRALIHLDEARRFERLLEE